MTTLAERVEALLVAWTGTHGDAAKDIEGMELYGAAYRECISDVQGALIGDESACSHRYRDEADGSLCIRAAHPHNPNGHEYVSRDGSAVNDRHTEGGHG